MSRRWLDVPAPASERGDEVYNVGDWSERPNLWMTWRLLALLDKPESLIRFVTDRPGHDRLPSVDSPKARAPGWAPRRNFEGAPEETV